MEVMQERLGQYMAANKIDNAVEAWVNAMACDLGGRWPKNAFNKRGLWDKWHPGERYRKSWHYFMWGLPRPHSGESLLKIMRCAALFCCYDIIRDSSPLHTVSHGVNEARNAAERHSGSTRLALRLPRTHCWRHWSCYDSVRASRCSCSAFTIDRLRAPSSAFTT